MAKQSQPPELTLLCRPYLEAIARLEPDREYINTDKGTRVRSIPIGPLLAYMEYADITDPDFLDTFQTIDAAFVSSWNQVNGTQKQVVKFGNGGG